MFLEQAPPHWKVQTMAVRQFVITDPSDPEAFKDHVYDALKERKNIIVMAQPVLDEVAQRRGDPAEEKEFEFEPTFLGLDPSDYSLETRDVRKDRWVRITVQNDVRFTVRGEL